ncbi:MAG TPA: OmpA family protein [Myxococcaceae bacterium]|nr:OmpA family protein [Myxococcaceae bacterium]
MEAQPTPEPQRRAGSPVPWVLLFVSVLTLAAVLYLNRQALEEERRAAAGARQALEDLTERLRSEEALGKEAQASLAQLEEERRILLEQNQSLGQNLAEREAELERLTQTQGALQKQLQEEISKGEIILSDSRGRLQVDLVDRVLFGVGEATLSPRGEEVLARIGPVLAKAEGRIIQVSGHTDDSPISERLAGTFPTNWELSVARAVTVVRFLSEKAGVAPERLVATGHSQYRPVNGNRTPKGRARNRRIELLLVPELEAKPAKLEAVARE